MTLPMSEYLWMASPVSHERFVQRALDPHASAVVEACAAAARPGCWSDDLAPAAGPASAPGRSWRSPSRAGPRSRCGSRLLQDLAALARADPDDARALLAQRGLSGAQAQQALPAARGLYERVASTEQSVSIETFHGWFWRAAAARPARSGVAAVGRSAGGAAAAGGRSLERICRRAARGRCAGAFGLRGTGARIGDFSTDRLLRNFLDKRASGWSFAARSGAGHRSCLQPMREVLRAGGFFRASRHPGEILRQPRFIEALRALLTCWQSAQRPTNNPLKAIEAARSFLSGRPIRCRPGTREPNLLLTGKGEP